MLTTIQELESEIDQFQKNIKESNELMDILMSVVSLSKTQTETFETQSKMLQDELEKLPPELSNLFQTKVDMLVQEVHKEHQSYQTSVANLMEEYRKKLAVTEAAISKMPSEMDDKLQKNYTENVSGLKQIQNQYTEDLVKTNETFSNRLQAITEIIQAVPEQFKDNADQKYNTFAADLERMMNAHLAQLSDTEKRVIEFSEQLEVKYNSFVTKLEDTDIEQLYKYCQDMNRSINTKLGIVLGGVAIAVVISAISLFI